MPEETGYPHEEFTPRTIENDPSAEYDEEKTTVIFAEDLQAIIEQIQQIQDYLGYTPTPAEGTLIKQVSDNTEDISDNATAISDNATAIGEKITGVNTSKITVSDTAPSSPSEGDLWLDTSE